MSVKDEVICKIEPSFYRLFEIAFFPPLTTCLSLGVLYKIFSGSKKFRVFIEDIQPESRLYIGMSIWAVLTVLFWIIYSLKTRNKFYWTLSSERIKNIHQKNLVIDFNKIDCIIPAPPSINNIFFKILSFHPKVSTIMKSADDLRNCSFIVRLIDGRHVLLLFPEGYFQGGTQFVEKFLSLNSDKIMSEKKFSDKELKSFIWAIHQKFFWIK